MYLLVRNLKFDGEMGFLYTRHISTNTSDACGIESSQVRLKIKEHDLKV